MNESTSGTKSGKDQRIDFEIRSMFVEAYDVLAPFFDASNQWAGHSHEHLAYRALHEHFPQLSADQIFIIVDAARRVFSSGGNPAP